MIWRCKDGEPLRQIALTSYGIGIRFKTEEEAEAVRDELSRRSGPSMNIFNLEEENRRLERLPDGSDHPWILALYIRVPTKLIEKPEGFPFCLVNAEEAITFIDGTPWQGISKVTS